MAYNTCTTDEFIRQYVKPTYLQMENAEMAKAIKLPKNKEFNFAKKGGSATKYPWDQWFNGDLLMIERSDMVVDPNDPEAEIAAPGGATRDYNVPNDAMPPKIKTAARKRYKVCDISRVDADGNKLKDAFIIRGRDMTADERTAEDLKRAEEKAAREAAGEADDTATDDTATA